MTAKPWEVPNTTGTSKTSGAIDTIVRTEETIIGVCNRLKGYKKDPETGKMEQLPNETPLMNEQGANKTESMLMPFSKDMALSVMPEERYIIEQLRRFRKVYALMLLKNMQLWEVEEQNLFGIVEMVFNVAQSTAWKALNARMLKEVGGSVTIGEQYRGTGYGQPFAQPQPSKPGGLRGWGKRIMGGLT